MNGGGHGFAISVIMNQYLNTLYLVQGRLSSRRWLVAARLLLIDDIVERPWPSLAGLIDRIDNFFYQQRVIDSSSSNVWTHCHPFQQSMCAVARRDSWCRLER